MSITILRTLAVYRPLYVFVGPSATLLVLAAIANRPFGGGALIDRVQKNPYPKAWATDLPCQNWPEFLLKFIVSHPAITCAIPATSRVEHMRENMAAGTGELPDKKQRALMLKRLASL